MISQHKNVLYTDNRFHYRAVRLRIPVCLRSYNPVDLFCEKSEAAGTVGVEQMKMFLAIVLVVAVTMLILLSGHSSNAMKECQQTHSYDTCFQILNN
jgi:hypothetical protein